MLRFIFGDDIFISYSRRDGANYAAALASELSEPGRDFSCFLDQWGAEATNHLSKPVMRALGRSRVLVLVGTPGAIESNFVKQEVEHFSRQGWLRSHRPILPINIAGALDRVEWEKLTGLHRTPETEEARAGGLPSETVIRLITNSHSYTKRNQRVRLLSIMTLLLLVLSIGASVAATLQRRQAIAARDQATLAKSQADESAKKAREQEQLAKEQEKIAKQQAQLARENEERATQKEKEANTNAQKAEAQAALARANAAQAQAQQREAEKQTEIAGARQLAAQAEFAINQQPNLLPRGVSLAIDSLRLTPEFEPLAGYQPLRQGLDVLPRQLSLMSHPNNVHFVSFSPDGEYIATSGADQTARVWNAHTGLLIAQKSYRSFKAVVSLSQDAKYLAIGHNGTVEVWQIKDEKGQPLSDQDPRARQPVTRLAIRNPIAVAFSPNGGHLAAIGYGGSLVRVWDVRTWKVWGEIHEGALAMAFDPTSNNLLLVAFSGDKVGSVTMTDLERRAPAKWHNIARKKMAAFSADGSYLAAVDDLSAWVWRFNEAGSGWQEVSRIPHQGRVTAVAISRNGKELAVASKDGTARVWLLATQAEIARLTHDGIVNDVAFSGDGKYLATGSQDHTARLWEAVTKQLSPRLQHSSEVKAVAFAPDGQSLASASSNGRVRLWESPSGSELTPATAISASLIDGEDQYATRAIVFSPNGRYVAFSITNSTASVWDVMNGKEIIIESWEATDVLAISHDGRYLAAAYEDKIIVATANEVPKKLHTFDGHKAKALAFSPNGQYLAAACADGTARVWAMNDGSELSRLAHGGEVQALIFDADGKRLATASRDGFLRVWDWAASRPHEMTRLAQQNETRALAFSPTGEYLAHVSTDDDVWIWEMKTKREVARLVHAGDISSVAFSPDGNYIATASDDQTARIWVWKPEDLIKQACSRLPRDLPANEQHKPGSKACQNLP